MARTRGRRLAPGSVGIAQALFLMHVRYAMRILRYAQYVFVGPHTRTYWPRRGAGGRWSVEGSSLTRIQTILDGALTIHAISALF